MKAEAVLDAALHTRAPWAAVDGLFDHPAGLHPDAAAGLMALLPPGPVLDPFVGGGAVALAARRAGRAFFGRDVSEAALCVTRARTWLPTDPEAEAYQRAVHDLAEAPASEAAAATAGMSEPLRSAVQATLGAVPAAKARRRLAGAALRAWRTERAKVPAGTPDPDLARGDARALALPTPVAGILTSPPYPGVYDYDRWTAGLRDARGQRGDIAEEIGARRTFDGKLEQATAAWAADTRAWTRAAVRALRPGGRMVIVIGDGPRPDGPIDTRVHSISAAAEVGLRLVAAATAEPGSRPSPRREHALLFERPTQP